MELNLYQFKRTAVHNLCVTLSDTFPLADIVEGLVLPQELMRLGDIVPYERVVVTRHSGDNWRNRVHTFAIPGDGEAVEARGSLAHLLRDGEYCCVITATYLNLDQYKVYRSGELSIPAIDIRFRPQYGQLRNDRSSTKKLLEFDGRETEFETIDSVIAAQRKHFPRVMLSNLAMGLEVSKIERKCLEMSAELPVDIMRKAGLVKNQTIFVYNASRGGMSAESYIVPNTQDNSVVVSGALSRVADVGDIISEAAFTITDEIRNPIIYSVLSNREMHRKLNDKLAAKRRGASKPPNYRRTKTRGVESNEVL